MKTVTRISLALALVLSALVAPAARADASPPTVAAPSHRLIVGHRLGTSYIPARISWSASDVDGIKDFWLQQSTDFGAWATVGLPTPTAQSVVRQLYPGHYYQFRVRARDNANPINTSDWATGQGFKALAYDSSSTAIKYSSGWFTRALSSAYRGSVRTRCYGHGTGCNDYAVGATATVTFWGRTVGFVAPRSPFTWLIDVYVDGAKKAQLDLSGGNEYRRINYVYAWSTPGTHTMMVKFAPSPSPYRPNMDVDAFVVLR
jgi:hypothetical protein